MVNFEYELRRANEAATDLRRRSELLLNERGKIVPISFGGRVKEILAALPKLSFLNPGDNDRRRIVRHRFKEEASSDLYIISPADCLPEDALRIVITCRDYHTIGMMRFFAGDLSLRLHQGFAERIERNEDGYYSKENATYSDIGYFNLLLDRLQEEAPLS